MAADSGPGPPTADQLRNRLVDEILAERRISATVERAMRTVPRDAFLPGLDLESAYTDQAVTIKDNPGKPLPLSCASVPSVVAMMLKQLGARTADDVLKIGAGTGYNAALLAELVAHGSVTTVDIDPDVALHARTRLNATGYEHVTVIEHDDLLGAPNNAPYDRIIATIGVWGIPATWTVWSCAASSRSSWLGRRSAAPTRRLQQDPFCGPLVKIRRVGKAPEGGLNWDRSVDGAHWVGPRWVLGRGTDRLARVPRSALRRRSNRRQAGGVHDAEVVLDGTCWIPIETRRRKAPRTWAPLRRSLPSRTASNVAVSGSKRTAMTPAAAPERCNPAK